MNLWLVIVIVGVLTFLTRFSFIWLLRDSTLSPRMREVLSLVPVAVLSVIVIQATLVIDDRLAFELSNPRIWAAVVAAAVAWRTRNALATITAGMAVLWSLMFVLPK